MTVVKKGATKPSVKFSRSRTLKRAADSQVVFDQPLELEDEFQSLYQVTQDGVVIIAPPFNPNTLKALCTRNNLLQQCVHAMEVNVDGTGHTIEPITVTKKPPKEPKQLPPVEPPPPPAPSGAKPEPGKSQIKKDDEGEDDNPDKKKAEAFFKEPYPGMSMVTLRRKLRVDLEQTGCGYLEALRNAAGELVFLRHVEASTVRMLKLDAPVPVEVKMARDGQEEQLFTLQMRERRFVQIIGQNKLYFREFGSSRQISNKTGKWAEKGKTLPVEELGTELLQFVVDNDNATPYGVPRWINNLPSVLGSRKAEEYNLDFFDSGGLPPAMILIAGGAMTTPVKEQVLAHMSGRGKNKHRAAVVEVQSASGGIEGAGKVSVTVEKFGDSRMGDALFHKYDQATEERVRVSFRLPPLFVGRSGDYSFATAMVSYMIAEEQVFAPERKEFDEIMNSKILPALGVKDYKFVSKPITLKNVEVQMEAVNLASDVLDGEERVSVLNEIAGTSMQYSAAAEQKADLGKIKSPFLGGDPSGNPAGPGSKAANKALGGVNLKPTLGGDITKKEDGPLVLSANDILHLAAKWSIATKLDQGEMSKEERAAIISFVESLRGPELDLFNKVLATKQFVGSSQELDGLGMLAGTCSHLAARTVQSIAKDEGGGAVKEMALAVKHSSEQTLEIVRRVLEDSHRPINLTVEMKMAGRKGKRHITLADGRKATLIKEDGKKIIKFEDGRQVVIEGD